MKTAWLLLIISSCVVAQNNQKLTINAKGVTAFRFTPDNRFFVMADGPTATLYNSGNDTKIKELSGSVNKAKAGHTKPIYDIAFSNSSAWIATAGADKKIKIWELPLGEVNATLEGHEESVMGMGFAGDGKLLVSAGEDGTVRLWDLATKSSVYTKKDFQKKIRGFDVSIDGKYVALAGAEKFILVYETTTGKLVQRMDGHTDWVRSLAFSPDGKTLASGGDDKMIFLWETETGNKLKEFPQKGWVYDLEFSQDGKYLAAALEKYAIHFYNVSTGLIALNLNDFKSPVFRLAINPNGKEVACQEEFGSGITFRSIESLGIVPPVRLKDKQDKSAPLILVSNPPNIQDNRVRVYTDLVDLRGVVTDESGVRSLKINGIETPIRENGNFLINIPLSFGDNYITMEVSDINDNIALKKFVITRKSADGEVYNPALARNHLLVVGINNYQHWPRLNNAVKDANDIVSVLMTRYSFEFSNVTVLKDEQATRSNMYNALRSLIGKISPQDNLVVYFSGHGYFDELLSEGYWIPVDAEVNSTGDYISNTEILKILGNINSQHTFLIADACFSGALFADSRRGYTDNVEKFKSRWGLASGRLETVSDGEIGANSPFATRVLRFLQENNKDKFPVSELIQYVKTQVAEDTNQTPIGNPLKALGDEGGEMVFYKKKG
ncbi:caspase family protein [Oscillatoria amoena NRMC-F 0135]|nr:caspase family protein [Oscillatoria amoena NRMC-F 0135]